MILVGGPVHTMGRSAGAAAVEAVRVDGRRVAAAGGLAELRGLGDAGIVDLDGRCLMPGFVDAHTHPLMHGQCASWADLSGAASIDEVVKLLREHSLGLEAGTAVRGFGYDQHRLAEDRHPSATDLDRVAADRPVVIMHTSGHGYVANSHALAEASITSATPTPPGGLIDRDGAGNPLGRVFDAACDMLTGPDGVKITNHGPNFHLPEEPEALDARLDEPQEAFLAAGITTVGDCQVTDREMTNYLRARDTGRLRIRVSMYVLSSHVDGLRRLGIGSTLGDARLAIAGVKHYADGSLISGTAYVPCGCGTPTATCTTARASSRTCWPLRAPPDCRPPPTPRGPTPSRRCCWGSNGPPGPTCGTASSTAGSQPTTRSSAWPGWRWCPCPSPPRCTATATGYGATTPTWPSACPSNGTAT